MKFSQRIGKTPIKVELEREGMSQELRNSLWNAILGVIELAEHTKNHEVINQYFEILWVSFFKFPIDKFESRSIYTKKEFIREWFFKSEWFLSFDFIEFSGNSNLINIQDGIFIRWCNYHLKKEMSAYRFVGNQLVEINSQEEVIEIEEAIKKTDQFSPVKTHLKTALGLLSDRKNPDYRNSVKESISAIEALAIIIVGKQNGTLGNLLKEIEKKHELPQTLKTAFDKLYGYTSDSNSGGIRHALLENSAPVDLAEARFMLVTCSAFVNYLIYKTKLNNS